MKFNEFKYQRPDLDAFQKKMEALIDLIGEDNDFETERNAVESFFKLDDELDTLGNLVFIRNAVDTTDAFYEEEQNFFDENNPKLQEYSQRFNKKQLHSKHSAELKNVFG